MLACDPAIAACTAGAWDGVEVCDEPGKRQVQIANAISADGGVFFDAEEYLFLDIINAGAISAGDAAALALQGQRISYVGHSGALMTSREVGLAVLNPSLGVSVLVDHDINAPTGIRIQTDPIAVAVVDVELNGAIEASVTGISVWQVGGGATDVDIGAGAEILLIGSDPQAAAIRVNAGGPTTVTLGGKILGEHQRSVLGWGDDTLALLPGFELEGTIDAGDSSPLGDTLVLGGLEGETATLDLGAIGTADVDGEPLQDDDQFLGFENFAKTGRSTWTLTGAADRQFDLDIGGTGRVHMDLISALLPTSRFTLDEGGILSGVGTLGIIDVVKGTLAPGNFSVGSLAAAEAIFRSESIFEIEVEGSEADQLQVTRAEIRGGTVQVINPGLAFGTYDILLSSEPIEWIGDFIISRDSDFYDASISRDPTDDPTKVVLTLTRSALTFSAAARTPQQAAVAAILDGMGTAAPYAYQFGSLTPDERAAFLEQLAGADLAATSGALIQNAAVLSSASLGRIQQQSGTLGPTDTALGYAAFASNENWTDGLHPSVWGRVIAGTSTIGGAVAGSVALVGGADVEVGDDWTLGLLAGMGSSSIVSGGTTTGSTDLSAGFYGAKEFGAFAFRFGGSLTHHSLASSRTVTAPGLTETFTASYGALTAQVFAEAAVEFDLGPVGLELFGDLAYARNFSPGFTETGGAGALTVASSSSDAVETVLGIRASHQTAFGTTLVTTGAMLGWKHRFMAAPATMNSLAGGTPFEVAGASSAGHALVAGADLRLDIDERTAFEATYALEWGGSGAAQTISARYTRLF